MKRLLQKIGSKAVMGIVMLLLTFSPFVSLTAQAAGTSVFDTGTTPIQNTGSTGQTNSGTIGNPSAQSPGNASDFQVITQNNGNNANIVTNTNTDFPNSTQTTGINSIPNANGTTGATTPAASNNGVSTNNSSGCGFTSTTDFAVCLTSIVYVFTVGIGSGFAYVAAYFFNFAIQVSLNGAAYALGFVSISWTTARDLANMAFLFILIYIAFIIIFNADTHGTRSMLAGVIIVALLVNFSFFFTRLVIDAGNILSIEFYNSIQAPSVATTAAGQGLSTGNLPSAATAATAVTNTVNYLSAPGFTNLGNGLSGFGQTKDLTAGIMNMLQIQNLFNNTSFQNFQAKQQGFWVTAIALTFLYICAAIMLWLLTVMFVAAGIKFLARVVVLWFLIIASPLALIARTLPQFKKYFDNWLSMLISHSFYPVVFMFVFLVLTNFANQMSCNTAGTTSTTSACTNLVGSIFNSLNDVSGTSVVAGIGLAVANVGIRLGLVLAVMFIGMKASQSVSVMGGKAAESAGNWFGTGLLKAYNVPYKRLGPGAWAGGVDRTLRTGKFSASLFGKGFTLDNRVTRTIGKFGNSPIGYEARRYVTKPLADTAVPASKGESFTKMKERQNKERAEVGANQRDIKNTEDREWMVANKSAYQAAKKKAAPTRSTAEDALVAEGDRIKSRMKEFKERDFEGMKFAEIKSIIDMVNEGQLKTLNSSKNLSDDQKEELTTDWNTHNPSSHYQKAHKELDELRNISKELHGLGITLTQVDHHVGGAATAAKSGALVDKSVINAMHKEVKAKISEMDQDIVDANKAGSGVPKATIVQMRENRDKLKDAGEHLNKLRTETGDVQANIGGEKEEGKFRTK